MMLQLLAEMTGSIHVGLAAMGVGIGIGLTGLGMATAVGRNPGAFTPILVHGILAIAFTEAIAPKSNGSSTIGMKKSVVLMTA